MSPEAAIKVLEQELVFDAGRYYSAGANLSLGAGKIYTGIRSPRFNRADQLFDTAETPALVLTHECDVDQANARPFNDSVLVCPIIKFEDFVAEYWATLGDDHLRSFLSELARRNISRVAFLPWGLQPLPMGGLVYLNQITSTHISAFSRVEAAAVGATTEYGLRQIDLMLTNHLLGPRRKRLHLPPRRSIKAAAI